MSILDPWMACCCSADSRRGPAPSTGSDDHRHSVIWGSFRSYWVVACIDAFRVVSSLVQENSFSSFGGCDTDEAVPFVRNFQRFRACPVIDLLRRRFFEFDDLPTQAKRGLNGPPEHSEFGKGFSRRLLGRQQLGYVRRGQRDPARRHTGGVEDRGHYRRRGYGVRGFSTGAKSFVIA